MEIDTFTLLAKFIVRTKRIVGAIDSERLVNDRSYAVNIFKKVEAVGEEEDVMLALSLRHKLGFLSDFKTTAPSTENGNESGDEKYTFGARG